MPLSLTGATQSVLSENKAYSNGLNGYLILGNDTKMLKNIAGDTGTGNAGDGIRVVGSGGDITENTSKSNTLVGFRVDVSTARPISRQRRLEHLEQQRDLQLHRCRREFADGLRASAGDTVAAIRSVECRRGGKHAAPSVEVTSRPGVGTGPSDPLTAPSR